MNYWSKTFRISNWHRFTLFLVSAYFSQICPYYQLSHNHDGGLLEIEINFHTVEIDLGHKADHKHEGDAPQTDEHQHFYDLSFNRHWEKIQKPKLLTSAEQNVLSPIIYNSTDDFNLSYWVYEEYPDNSNYYTASVVRGPPLSV